MKLRKPFQYSNHKKAFQILKRSKVSDSMLSKLGLLHWLSDDDDYGDDDDSGLVTTMMVMMM